MLREAARVLADDLDKRVVIVDPSNEIAGDGDIPLRRILGGLLDAGYRGFFELEILGPRIEAEGYESAVRRSLAHLGTLLEELGAGPPG